MNKKYILFLILLIMFSSFVYSVPSMFNKQTNILNDYQILYPKNIYFEKNKDFYLYFKLYDSNSKLIENLNFTCIANIYDKNNKIIINSYLNNSNTNNYNKILNINSSVYNNIGIYTYDVSCNTSTQGAFISNFFVINDNGLESDTNLLSTNGFLIIGVLFFIAFFFLYLQDKFKGENNWVKSLKNNFFYMSLLHIVLAVGFLMLLTDCTNGFCYDLFRFSALFKTYFSVMALYVVYVIWYYIYFTRIHTISDTGKK